MIGRKARIFKYWKFPCMGGLAPLAPNKITMGGLAPLALDKLRPWCRLQVIHVNYSYDLLHNIIVLDYSIFFL